MTLFEYLAVAFSLVLSFTALRLIQGLPHAVRKSRRYWVHLSHVGAQLLATTAVFWTIWSYRDVEWNFAAFALMLLMLGGLYFNACALIPETPSSVSAWEAHFYEVRTTYFLGVTVWVVLVVAITTTVLSMPLLHPARVAHLVIFAAGLIGTWSNSRSVHGVIGAGLLTVLLLFMLTIAYQPGAVAPT